MYMDEYKRWLEAELEDFDLKAELLKIEGDEDAIADRFAVALQFGTAGLRGTLGAGTNRMNIWVVRQATQGIADWVKTQGGTQTVAIAYDSRLKGWDKSRIVYPIILHKKAMHCNECIALRVQAAQPWKFDFFWPRNVMGRAAPRMYGCWMSWRHFSASFIFGSGALM